MIKDKAPAMSTSVQEPLEHSSPEALRQLRSHHRCEVKARVTMQPANTSDLLKLRVEGTTGDITPGGFSGLFPIPVRVGDVYRFTFDRQVLDLPLTFARCVRCQMEHEGAYEAGFAFFAPLRLPDHLRG